MINARINSSYWTSKVNGFQRLRGLVNVSTTYAELFVQKIRYYCKQQKRGFERTGCYVNYFSHLESGLLSCLRDQRSQVVKECCVTIAYIAQQFQYKVVCFI